MESPRLIGLATGISCELAFEIAAPAALLGACCQHGCNSLMIMCSFLAFRSGRACARPSACCTCCCPLSLRIFLDAGAVLACDVCGIHCGSVGAARLCISPDGGLPVRGASCARRGALITRCVSVGSRGAVPCLRHFRPRESSALTRLVPRRHSMPRVGRHVRNGRCTVLLAL